jgi:hypothetical protein
VKKKNKKRPTKEKKAKPFETFPLVKIEWQDAAFASDVGWLDTEDFKPCLVAASAVGYKVFEGKNEWGEDVVVLSCALTYQTEGLPHFTSSFTIPKGMIRSMKKVNV